MRIRVLNVDSPNDPIECNSVEVTKVEGDGTGILAATLDHGERGVNGYDLRFPIGVICEGRYVTVIE